MKINYLNETYFKNVDYSERQKKSKEEVMSSVSKIAVKAQNIERVKKFLKKNAPRWSEDYNKERIADFLSCVRFGINYREQKTESQIDKSLERGVLKKFSDFYASLGDGGNLYTQDGRLTALEYNNGAVPFITAKEGDDYILIKYSLRAAWKVPPENYRYNLKSIPGEALYKDIVGVARTQECSVIEACDKSLFTYKELFDRDFKNRSMSMGMFAKFQDLRQRNWFADTLKKQIINYDLSLDEYFRNPVDDKIRLELAITKEEKMTLSKDLAMLAQLVEKKFDVPVKIQCVYTNFERTPQGDLIPASGYDGPKNEIIFAQSYL